MAIFRNVQISFWTDIKVTDDFTPEDRYFYLYLITNPHTTLCGCYEISKKQMALELGYSIDTIDNLIKRFSEVHGLIKYSAQTKEILLLNWHKYNWTKSPNVLKALEKEIPKIKEDDFKVYCIDTLSILYGYPMQTTDTDTDTDTDTVTDSISDTDTDTKQANEFDEIIAELPAEVQSVIKDFIEHRKELNKVLPRSRIKPLTARGLKGQITKAQNISKGNTKEFISLFREAIANGWTGVWETNKNKRPLKGQNEVLDMIERGLFDE